MNKMRIGRYLLLTFGLVALQVAGCHKTERAKRDHPRLAPGVSLEDLTFHSKALGREMPYRVFLPAKVEAGIRLPTVYLLHGNGGSYRDWSNYSDVARYASQGLILVMTDGGSSYFTNAVERPEDKYEDYLVSDLIADVETRFPAAQGRADSRVL